MGSDDKIFSQDSPLIRFVYFLGDLIEKPVIWFRETVVVPNQKEYYWYHENLRRVPTIDECYTEDVTCIYEADQQYKRDRLVDKFILRILRKRYDYCIIDNPHDHEDCNDILKAYERGLNNYFIKYGDLGFKDSALTCYMKQKNRMAWERRHGEVGTGRREQKAQKPEQTTENTNSC